MIEIVLAAWVTTVAVIAIGIGVVNAVFRLMGPDYDDQLH